MNLEDKVKIKLYKEFHEDNKELFKRDIQQYWSECTRYIERVYHERLQQEKDKPYGSKDTQTK